MSDLERIPWEPIRPLPAEQRTVNGTVAALDALREEWRRFMDGLTEAERVRIRQRSLRKLAVETGIIEGLYDLEWGLTLTLVAEGFTRDVVERVNGRISEPTLQTLRAQKDSLEMVLDFVRQQRTLGTSFIKELHAALTRTQDTYDAHDALGRPTRVPLPRGTWKLHPNHVERKDGTLLEYAPPEQVDSEMDRLVRGYEELEQARVHPIVIAAWLHHRFVQIHPFADGNGRVARALVLLVLEKHHYAPLVVDRFQRDKYILALDAANTGNLHELVRLFTALESAALTGELERAEPATVPGSSEVVARSFAAAFAARRRREDERRVRELRARAVLVSARIAHWFGRQEAGLAQIFRREGIDDFLAKVDSVAPGGDRCHWFRRQIIESAKISGHFARFDDLTSWASLRIRMRGLQVRYLASLHGAGQQGGVMAVTTFAEIGTYAEPTWDTLGGFPASEPTPVPTTAEAFSFVHSEGTTELEARVPDLEALLDEGLAVALKVFFEGL